MLSPKVPARPRPPAEEKVARIAPRREDTREGFLANDVSQSARFAWPLDYCREGSDKPESDYNHMFQVIDEEVTKFKASESGKDFWGLRMIWTSMRGLGTRSIIQDMDNCIATKLAWPHLVAGYDLVGPEDLGRPLKDLLPELFWVGSPLLSLPLFHRTPPLPCFSLPSRPYHLFLLLRIISFGSLLPPRALALSRERLPI